MRFIVAHTGARRGYAVPVILRRAGLLERFYTDVCANAGLGKLVCATGRLIGNPPAIQRLGSRRLPPELVSKTRTFWQPNISYFLRSLTAGADAAELYRANLQWQCRLGERMAAEGFGNATWLHSFLDEFPTLIFAAKRAGLRIVSELYILLSTDRILSDERSQFPGWEPDLPDYDNIIQQVLGKRPLFHCTDCVLCPSEVVREDAIANFGFRREQTALVPYGVHDRWFTVRNQPIRGRVLFAGTAELRKGIHYLGFAADRLFARNFRGEFRIAGNAPASVRSQKACRHLNFLGRTSREKMAEEFACADIVVLPSLAEGSASVIYEALAAGVPIVTTPEAGSVVRDGIEGRIVPSRDPDALANAITEIVEDRQRRERMAHAARERAQEFTWEHYDERLVGALKNLDAMK
jgi:glycosyltransferase involved in cell wall biosynthesis